MPGVLVLADYSLRLLPGLLVLVAVFTLLGRSSVALRIVVLVLGFVLMRDLMTPLGMWRLGTTDLGLVWLRFTDDPTVLVGFGLTGVVVALALARRPDDLARLVVWGRPGPRDLALALGAAAVIVVPLVLLLRTVPLAERGGPVAVATLLPLAVLAVGGNLLEEVLFRGLLQGHLATLPGLGPGRVVLLSALFFAAGHVFLAATVTDVGVAILVFTFVEGLACAWVRHRSGVLAAAVTHGTVIFALASGL